MATAKRKEDGTVVLELSEREAAAVCDLADCASKFGWLSEPAGDVSGALLDALDPTPEAP